MNDRSQERTIIMYPSRRVMRLVFRTKKKGKMPVMKVIEKLMRRAERPLSFPFMTETNIDSNMKSALTSRA